MDSERPHQVGVAGWASREGLYIVTTATLLSVQGWRLSHVPELWGWGGLAMLLAGPILADFISGLYHWAADTWGSVDTPFLGPRFIEPFRVHHETAAPLLACNTIECIGDTALMAVPWLTLLFFVPLEGPVPFLGLLMVSSFIAVMPTNLIHKWSHMDAPPPAVRVLQRLWVVLPKSEHARHHRSPHLVRYCITHGWLNPLLDATRFWRGLEWLISRLTGAVPRAHTAANADTAANAAEPG